MVGSACEQARARSLRRRHGDQHHHQQACMHVCIVCMCTTTTMTTTLHTATSSAPCALRRTDEQQQQHVVVMPACVYTATTTFDDNIANTGQNIATNVCAAEPRDTTHTAQRALLDARTQRRSDGEQLRTSEQQTGDHLHQQQQQHTARDRLACVLVFSCAVRAACCVLIHTHTRHTLTLTQHASERAAQPYRSTRAFASPIPIPTQRRRLCCAVLLLPLRLFVHRDCV